MYVQNNMPKEQKKREHLHSLYTNVVTDSSGRAIEAAVADCCS